MPVIISNYANDIIEYKNNCIIKWWPALYIEKYFKYNNLKYKILTWWVDWKVLILKKNWVDVGIIKSAPEIKIKTDIKSEYFIISTLLNEFNLININKLKWLVFCDIQWYIRELNSIDRVLIDQLPWLNNINFLKVADYEFQYLTSNLVNKFIENWWVIIITTWSKWIIRIINNKWETNINISIWDFDDTIWAWDTFLASFADNYFKSNNLEESLIKSSSYVYQFLKRKNNNI